MHPPFHPSEDLVGREMVASFAGAPVPVHTLSLRPQTVCVRRRARTITTPDLAAAPIAAAAAARLLDSSCHCPDSDTGIYGPFLLSNPPMAGTRFCWRPFYAMLPLPVAGAARWLRVWLFSFYSAFLFLSRTVIPQILEEGGAESKGTRILHTDS